MSDASSAPAARRALPGPGRTRVMAIVNVTPDSFSDGGRHLDPRDAVAAAVAAEQAGADLIDVGAVSTRPGSAPVDADTEWSRLAPVLGPLRAAVSLPLSLDTTSSVVLGRALGVGVDMLNDTSALADDPELGPLAADAGLPVVLMHRRGTPATMQERPHYDDAVGEVLAELDAALERARAAGLSEDALWLDPGIGFGKRLEDNLALLAGLPALVARGHRTLLGCSRKRFLGALTGGDVGEREHATTATTLLAARAGVDVVRVHEPRAAVAALTVWYAALGEGADGP